MTVEKKALPAPVILQPAEGAKVGRRPQISGTAQLSSAGAKVEIFKFGSVRLYAAEITQDGRWSVTPDKDLEKGLHAITARIVSDGQTSEFSPTRNFTVE